METLDSDPFSWLLSLLLIDTSFLLPVMALIILVICSGLISGSEVAFFSISGSQISQISESQNLNEKVILKLLKHPRLLLGTILIANNLINIAIVILFTIISAGFLGEDANGWLIFLIDVVIVTFILVLLGEVIPKIYANRVNITFARFMAYPMLILNKILFPLSSMLVGFTSVIEKRINKRGHDVSIKELKEAIEITAKKGSTQEEKKILKGIVNFGNIIVKQIMTSRVDVMALDLNTPYVEVVAKINEFRYSRIPVFEESFDNVKGILYIKDLIPYLDKDEMFEWQHLVREPYYVPENKKIDDLLKEFQEKKVHMAIVVDEYGGSSGIITLEDILEEIVGEINDEFDEDEIYYSKLDEKNFVFDAKTSLSDAIRIAGLNEEDFENFRNEVESIGGLAVELLGKVPKVGEQFNLKNYNFKIEAADRKRVKRIKISITKPGSEMVNPEEK